MAALQRLTRDDLPRLRQFWIEHWGGEEMISRGQVYRPEQLEGFVVEEGSAWIGLLTFFIKDGECEVTSLDSLREGQGIGSKLIDRAVEEALARGCKRLFLITTNDNLNALGFYQKRGLKSLLCTAARSTNHERENRVFHWLECITSRYAMRLNWRCHCCGHLVKLLPL